MSHDDESETPVPGGSPSRRLAQAADGADVERSLGRVRSTRIGIIKEVSRVAG